MLNRLLHPDRRQFLHAGSAAALGLALSPHRARAADQQVDHTIRIAPVSR
ncbi:twin-arginine translocation signal domain-containing protein [Methylobacterium sp.]|nr:twin-arginine translocation signal domain-containing protein [Methylobacterium sp.]